MKIYIDCGAFKGETLVNFPHPEFKRYAFECNPLLKDFQYPEDVTVIRKAVWWESRYLPFYINPNNHDTEGCSLMRSKTTGDLDKSDPKLVECVDFAAELTYLVRNGEFTIVKMNIEGAEYSVLDHLLFTGAIMYIDELLVYWHYKKVSDISEERHLGLLNNLKNISGLKVVSFY